MRKTVCIVTGSRAEWGLFYPLAKEIASRSEEFVLKIVATGAHLSTVCGSTSREILDDGFGIDQQVPIDTEAADEKQLGICVGTALQRFAEAFDSIRPDLVFLLGDRYETFAAAIACLFLKLPTAHIHGGEVTEGSLDDTMRHCISKMASLHFTATESYRRRVIQLGEDPERVFNVGALGIDNIRHTRLLTRRELEEALGERLGDRHALVTYHPPTAVSREVVRREIDGLLDALRELNGITLVFTRANPDIYSDEVVAEVDRFVAEDATHRLLFASMGRVLYLTALSLAEVVVGNSSSGIIEAPALGVPTVNVGRRQDGRVRASSIIDVDGNRDAIRSALAQALSNGFRRACRRADCPYGDGTAAARIADVVAKTENLRPEKKFYDTVLDERVDATL